MKLQIAGRAAVIAMVAICVTAAQASAASHHHKARKAVSAATTVRVALASPGYLTPASYLVPASSVPVILGVGF
jgi:hypothetical protein